MLDGLAITWLQTDQLLRKAVIRPFRVARLLADEGCKPGPVQLRRLRLDVHEDVIAFLHLTLHILGCGIHLAQVFHRRVDRLFIWRRPLVGDADRVIVSQVHLGSERDFEGQARRLERIDRFEGPGRTRLYVRFLEDVGVFGIHKEVHRLLDDGLFAIRPHDHVIGSLARAKAGDLSALRDLARGAAFVGIHLLRFYFHQ